MIKLLFSDVNKFIVDVFGLLLQFLEIFTSLLLMVFFFFALLLQCLVIFTSLMLMFFALLLFYKFIFDGFFFFGCC